MGKIVQFCKAANEITVREDGSIVVSVVGTARLTGVSPEGIRCALNSATEKPSRLAKKLIEGGFKAENIAVMTKEGVNGKAMPIIAYYYAHQAGQHCKPEAKRLHKQFEKNGAKVTLLELKGVDSDLQKPVKIEDEITIREDGVAVVSIRGVARLAGVNEKSLRKHFSGADFSANKLTGKLAAKGFSGADLSAKGIPDQAVGVILKYYAYDAGPNCTEEAKHFWEFIDDFSVRVWCYSMKGMVEVKTPIQQQPQLPEPEPQPTSPVEVLLPQQQPEISNPVEKAKQVKGVVAELLENIQLGQTPEEDKVLKAQVAVSAIQAHCPELADALSPVKAALATTATAPKTDDAYFTPTALGRRLDMSARAVNNRLKEMGLQVKNPSPIKGDSTWLPTETGKSYSTMEVGDQRRLNWSERVLELFNQTPKLFKGEAVA
ncbi:MAG: hypothetical protein AAF959_05205 [Cyanobacteria bacterium P01_D01_bin.56]